MSLRIAPALLCPAAAMLLALHCSSGGIAGDTGAGSETVSMLCMPDGSPAQAAAVVAVSAAAVPAGPVQADTTLTDSMGRYSFPSLAAGVYNLYGAKDSLVSLHASVTVDADGDLVVAGDTLRDTLHAPGSVRGIVGLQAGDDPRRVLVLVLGSQCLTSPDSAGAFALAGLAAGAYRVRFLPLLAAYDVLDTVLAIRTGVDAALDDTVWLRYLGGPVPRGLRVSLDTLTQLVTLTWNSLPAADVSGYHVMRRMVDSSAAEERANVGLIADTSYTDSFAIQGRTYEYRIQAVDPLGNLGTVYSAPVRVFIDSAFVLVRTIGSPGTGLGELSTPVGIVVVGGKLYVAEQGNRRVQVFDTLGNALKVFGNTGPDTLVEPWEIAGHGESLYVADDRGMIRVYDTAGNYGRTITCQTGKMADLVVTETAVLCAIEAATGVLLKVLADGTVGSDWSAMALRPSRLSSSSERPNMRHAAWLADRMVPSGRVSRMASMLLS